MARLRRLGQIGALATATGVSGFVAGLIVSLVVPSEPPRELTIPGVPLQQAREGGINLFITNEEPVISAREATRIAVDHGIHGTPAQSVLAHLEYTDREPAFDRTVWVIVADPGSVPTALLNADYVISSLGFVDAKTGEWLFTRTEYWP